MTIKVGVVFSSTSVAAMDSDGLKNEDVLNDLEVYDFNTQIEVNAFLRGVDEGVGYQECVVREVEADSKVAEIGFGKIQGRSNKSTSIKLASVDERIAYEKGVMEGEGWGNYHELDRGELEHYLQAVEAATAAGALDHLIDFVKTPDELEEMEDQAHELRTQQGVQKTVWREDDLSM
jgi:hypothetical protein